MSDATHIERINGVGNPADGPSPLPAPKAEPMSNEMQPYRLLANSFIGGVLRRAGEIVMLRPKDAGPHHQLVTPPQPSPTETDHARVQALIEDRDRLATALCEAERDKAALAAELADANESVARLTHLLEDADAAAQPPPPAVAPAIAADAPAVAPDQPIVAHDPETGLSATSAEPPAE